MQFNDFLARLHNSYEVGMNIHKAVCPSCGATDALAAKQYDDRISVLCQNGCTEGEICGALGITEQDLTIADYTPMSALFKPLSDFEEQEAKWLIKGWIPEGQITLLAGDGGLGKTTIWCNIAAALSCGKPCILDKDITYREPKKVLILTTEDSISKTLKKKLRLAGADESNITALDLQSDRDGEMLSNLCFGSKDLSNVIRTLRPDLCIFDPVQGFISPDVNMGSRNAMRSALSPLIPLGEECGTSFLLICHSNKRKGAAGRDRIADSADLWDISRSVLIAGYTPEQGVRYLSNEKNNYAPLSDTVLFAISKQGLIEHKGTTNKRDRDYVMDSVKCKSEQKSAPQRDSCKEFILDTLR
ncbi:MAG: AAA family ATPase, partial [Clostridia bacterium]|nr:AAA family ATPase [Clostridia bacterium]